METFILDSKVKSGNWCIVGNSQQRFNVINYLLHFFHSRFTRIFEMTQAPSQENKFTCSSFETNKLDEILDFLCSPKHRESKQSSLLIFENRYTRSETLNDFLRGSQLFRTSVFSGVRRFQQYPNLDSLDFLIWFPSPNRKDTTKIRLEFFPDVPLKKFTETLQIGDCFIVDNYNGTPVVYRFEYTATIDTVIYHSVCDNRLVCETLHTLSHVCHDSLGNYLIPDVISMIIDFIHLKKHLCCSQNITKNF